MVQRPSAAGLPEHHLLRRGAYGISAASKAYFNKPVDQLTVAEGALLAALIQRPSTLDPASIPRVPPRAELGARRHGIDGRAPQRRSAQQVFPPTVPPDQASSENVTTGPNGLIERQVTKELLDLFNIDQQTLNTQGLADHHDHRPPGTEGGRGRGVEVSRRPDAGHALRRWCPSIRATVR